MESKESGSISAKNLVEVCFAMAAFSANSILCRLAFTSDLIDPILFILTRLASGAVVLCLINYLLTKRVKLAGTWLCGFLLFVYVAAFSVAYSKMPASSGALILFGTVQLTIILDGLFRGERFDYIQCIGFLFAIIGFLFIFFPDISLQPSKSAIMMIVAGIAWGAYSIFGRKSYNPISETAGNFVLSLPFATAYLIFNYDYNNEPTKLGLLYACLSGSVASGFGYAAWYTVLPQLSAIRAASVQLSVPVMTAFAAVFLIGERISAQLIVAATMIIFGIAIIIFKR
jgi:drug/metabolite transporter (DMT)-like permease